MSVGAVSEFVYKLPGKPGSSRPGAHRSHMRGPGLAFSNYARLLDQPDPRRLDLRASIRDVNRDWLVRANYQHSATAVQVMIDVSASMRFGVPHSKLDTAADFVESLGYSAFSYGDALGMQAFDHSVRDDLSSSARNGRGVGSLMADSLRDLASSPPNRSPVPELSASALLSSALNLGQSSSLVFLVSDFHWPLAHLAPLFDQLSAVTLVPIVVWHGSETQPPGTWRWLRAKDVESNKQHSLLMRPSILKRWRDNIANRRSDINKIFSAQGITPFFIENSFNAEHLSQYFMETTL